MAVDDLPEPAAPPCAPEEQLSGALQARPFRGAIRSDWRISSFSWITTGAQEELPDRDSTPEAEEQPEIASGIFAFPRGAKAGTCLHQIFESIDFTEAGRPDRPHIVAKKLPANGFTENAHLPAIGGMVENVLSVPLDPSRPNLVLSSVENAGRLNELEFYFPLRQIGPGTLRDVFARFGQAGAAGFSSRLGRLQFDPVAGFMKGYIDLVFRADGRFYIVDWKSNWLGNRVENYSQTRMRAEMSDRLYVLQYHLYALALHSYLSRRLRGYDYEQHFGGVFYVFLRGVDPARPEYGIYRDRPGRDLMTALSETLIKPMSR
jgi:exodeoxyribonuclease V beta subunit